MTKSYKIEKISDLLKIPSDRIHDCLNEIADSFVQLAVIVETNGMKIDEIIFDQESFTWVDDGKKYAVSTIRVDDEVLEIKTFKEPEHDNSN
ncbi:hypothetical protein ABIC56_002903 [Acinetobacter bereziniae]|uniref:hypothetical protein n=1 Tax=Acinetobacter bereziniae TaxID=106648 RepID=UPI0028641A59|nr:hypothetical protein [Acinetobacter bereziniae]MDR6542928.1 hypothetical protein [Acinetobacter bereziniae]